jgi:steroid 5-alpha reductase family enzyme
MIKFLSRYGLSLLIGALVASVFMLARSIGRFGPVDPYWARDVATIGVSSFLAGAALAGVIAMTVYRSRSR